MLAAVWWCLAAQWCWAGCSRTVGWECLLSWGGFVGSLLLLSGQWFFGIKEAATLPSDPLVSKVVFLLAVNSPFCTALLYFIEHVCVGLCLGIEPLDFYSIFFYFSASFLIGLSIKYWNTYATGHYSKLAFDLDKLPCDKFAIFTMNKNGVKIALFVTAVLWCGYVTVSRKEGAVLQEVRLGIRRRFCTRGWSGKWHSLPRAFDVALCCQSSRSIWAMLSSTGLGFGWCCVKPGVGIDSSFPAGELELDNF